MNEKQQSSRFRIRSKITGIVLSTALLASTVTGLGATVSAVEAAPQLSAAGFYTDAPGAGALPDKVSDGVILHAWNWSFNAIKDNMQAIAEAGYTSVQTSPVQRPKDSSDPNSSQMEWWKVYQPTSLSFSPGGHPWFGSKEDFKAMCDEADKYGIKIIVDIVANHMANNTGKIGNTRADICSQNEATYRDDDSCWHLNGSTGINYSQQNRNGGTDSLTYGFGGWPDLNTGNKKVQNAIINLLKECYDLGADGFRFDAAKHIELPTDPGGASDFWPTVINGIESYANAKGHPVYCYGEILDDAATDIKNYTKYIAVTDSRAGNSTRYGIYDNDIGKAANSALNYNGISYDKIVLWAESHDTYANNNYSGESVKFSQDQINRSWAITAARQFPALYYVRPDNPRSQKMGQMSQNTSWKSKEVAEINKFHNAFVGESEYMSSSGNTVLVERGTTGVVLVNISGNGGQFSGKVNKMKDGTYKDQVSGGTFTVSGGNISGSIGSKGIAVVYDAGKVPSFGSVSASPSSTSFTDSITVTLNASNVSNATYTTSEGDSGSFTSGKTITLGGSAAVGTTVTLTLSGTKEDGSKATASYQYVKKDPNAVTTIYFDNSTYQWGSVYAYIYKDSGINPPVPVPEETIQFTNSLDWWSVKAYFFNNNGTVGAEWPGVDMTSIGDNGFGKTNYSITVPNGATHVVFNDNGGTQTGDLPLGNGVVGYWLDGSPDNAKAWYASSAPAAADAPADTDTTPCNAPWPGQKMQLDAATGYYKLVVPEDFRNGLVIFSDGAENTTKRYPADMEKGLDINDTSKLFSANHSWTDYVPPVPVKLSVILKASASTVTVGQSVTLTAMATNASGNVTYSFKAGSSVISSTGASATYTPSAAGTVTITVTATDSKNSATASTTITVQVQTLTNTSKISAATVELGGKITVTCSASGGTTPYQYSVSYKKSSSSKYSSVQTYSTNKTVTIKPAAAMVYHVLVKVKDAKGTVKPMTFDLTVTNKAANELKNLSKVSATNLTLGKSITITGAASGGTAPYYYAAYYRKSSSSTFTRIRDYSKTATMTVQPAAATTYDIRVKVKDAAGKVAVKDFSVKVTKPAASALTNKSTISATSLTLGKTLTVTGAATGGTAPYQYAAFYKKSTSTQYTKARAYSSNSKMTVNPASATTYDVRIKVKDSKGKIAVKDFSVKVNASASAVILENTSKLASATIKLGSSVTVNCSAKNGKAPYQYAVSVKKASAADYTSVKGYTTSTKITYKPAAATKYDLRVKVKDASGIIKAKVLKFTVTK
jgi:alpha-amylase